MKTKDRQFFLKESFTKIAKSLDISATRYEEAVERYQALGDWLDRDESTVREYSPKIYPQGSFLLGTVIKPITDEEDYDIDLVCEVDFSKRDISQESLKQLIGNEIQKYAQAKGFKKKAQEGKRCWTIEYADGAQFHVDILPAVPNRNAVGSRFPDTEISITDNTLANYSKIDQSWLPSNPKGFSEWFKNQMRLQLYEARVKLAESIGAEIEDVPEYKVKTTLQVAVQLLKRHRDICFRGKESKPISIIITTLAARSYRGENDIVTAMKNIVLRMENCFERAGSKSILRNPINEKELFTDRWTNNDEKDFFDWLRKAQEVFAGNITDSNEKGVLLLESAFGEKIARRVLQTNEHNSNFSAKISPTNVAINSPARPWRK